VNAVTDPGLVAARPVRRESPIADAHRAAHARLATLHAMPVPIAYPDESDASVATLALADVSCLVRAGLKGPGAADWLAAQGAPVPPAPNTWLPLPDGGVVARLARSEFLIEDGLGTVRDGTAARVKAALTSGLPGVTPVLRQDLALAIVGGGVNDLFVETCNVDLSAHAPAQRTLVLTSMVGVSVTLLVCDWHGRSTWRVWCDGTMGPWFWDTLAGIAREHGGGPIGLAALVSAEVLAAAVVDDDANDHRSEGTR
jgi:sarcosine oxidase subunit gamma